MTNDFGIEIEIIARPYTTKDMERDKKVKGTRHAYRICFPDAWA